MTQKREILRLIREATALAHKRNLDNAVLLAQQAARGIGPLVEHFAELGRRYGDELLRQPAPPVLHLVEGGAS